VNPRYLLDGEIEDDGWTACCVSQTKLRGDAGTHNGSTCDHSFTLSLPCDARRFLPAGIWWDDIPLRPHQQHAMSVQAIIALQMDVSVTWSGLRELVNGVAGKLRELASRGDRVSIWMSNRVEAIVMFLVLWREGIRCKSLASHAFTLCEIVELSVVAVGPVRC